MIEGWYDFTLKETGIRIDYVLLLILLFLIFIIYSRLVVSKEEKSIYERNYWLYAIIPIIAFSLIEGLRYARGVDYIGYVYTYLQSLDPKVENEPLFMLLNKGMLLMDFPYCIAFVVYSLFWIIGILHLCKNFTLFMYTFCVNCEYSIYGKSGTSICFSFFCDDFAIFSVKREICYVMFLGCYFIWLSFIICYSCFYYIYSVYNRKGKVF